MGWRRIPSHAGTTANFGSAKVYEGARLPKTHSGKSICRLLLPISQPHGGKRHIMLRRHWQTLSAPSKTGEIQHQRCFTTTPKSYQPQKGESNKPLLALQQSAPISPFKGEVQQPFHNGLSQLVKERPKSEKPDPVP
jgi:hypothetical protein